MAFIGTHLLVFTLCCVAVASLGAALLRVTNAMVRGAGWVLLAVSLAGLGLVALGSFLGRMGPERFWFREPAFYLAVAAISVAAVGWMRRPAPALLRLGLPGLLLIIAAGVLIVSRLDGRSSPLALAMPTLRQAAPALSYRDADGKSWRLSDLRGRVVLVNFWATWCVPCRREMPLLSRMQRDHADAGLVVLYLSLEEEQVLRPFLAANRFDGVQGRLEHAADYYDAGKFYPLSYLVTRDGRVAERWSGRPREEWLAGKILELLSADPS